MHPSDVLRITRAVLAWNLHEQPAAYCMANVLSEGLNWHHSRDASRLNCLSLQVWAL